MGLVVDFLFASNTGAVALDLSDVSFEWGDSYDAKVNRFIFQCLGRPLGSK